MSSSSKKGSPLTTRHKQMSQFEFCVGNQKLNSTLFHFQQTTKFAQTCNEQLHVFRLRVLQISVFRFDEASRLKCRQTECRHWRERKIVSEESLCRVSQSPWTVDRSHCWLQHLELRKKETNFIYGSHSGSPFWNILLLALLFYFVVLRIESTFFLGTNLVLSYHLMSLRR